MAECPRCDWRGHCWLKGESPRRLHLVCWACGRGFYIYTPSSQAMVAASAARGRHTQTRHDLWDRADELRAEYRSSGRSIEAMARAYRCAPSTMARVLGPRARQLRREQHRAHLEVMWARAKASKTRRALEREERLYGLVTEQAMTVPAAAAVVGISTASAARRLHRYVERHGLPWPRPSINLRHGARRYQQGCRCDVCLAGHLRQQDRSRSLAGQQPADALARC